MGETKIEVGKWYRHKRDPGASLARLTGVDTDRDEVWLSSLGYGAEWPCYTSIFCEAWEPWEPRVGEWVREVFFGNSRGPDVRVAEVVGRWIRVVNEAGLSAGGPAVSFEPCLPPAEVVPQPIKLLPHSEVGKALSDALRSTAERLERSQIVPVTEPPATTVLARRDDGAACRVCGGPAYLGLGLGPPECCAEPCPGPAAVPGPTERIVWRSVRGTFVDEGHPRAEKLHVAEGQGRTVIHPDRAEAVRLWWAGAR